MKYFVNGFLAAVLLLIAGALTIVLLGLAPVATDSPPLPFEKTITGLAMNARIRKEEPKSPPIDPSRDVYAAGAKIYRNNCAVCHGLPGQPETAIARGEFPKPPQLFEHGVTDDPPGETWWKVANGIRLTGMPGFKNSLSNTDVWQVSLMLANADKLPADVKATLAAPLPQ